MTIVLTPESLIVGRVNLPSSNQSDRVTVQVYKHQVRDGRPYWVPAANATTRSNGEFRVANLAAGTLSCSRPYYPVKIAITNMGGGSAMNVSVALEGHRGPGYSLGYTGDPSIDGMLPNGNYTVEATLQQDQQTVTGTVNITVKDAPLTHTSMAVIPTDTYKGADGLCTTS
jgi:hypothetical protein